MEGKVPTLDADKLEKLKEKYDKLKQANAVLKKGLLDKQEDCSRQDQKLKEKEATLRQQMEEIDHLQFQNGRMSKQLGALTAQVEEQRSKQQSSWSVGGLITGKQQQEDVQRAENELRVLRDELMMKIQENEDLHMRVYEAQKQHDDEAQNLRDAAAGSGQELERSSSELETRRREVERLSGENRDMAQRISSLDGQVSASATLSESLRSSLDSERHQARSTVDALQSRLSRWVPFDDTKFESWNSWSLGVTQGRIALRREEVLHQPHSAVSEVCKQTSGALQMWPGVLNSSSDEESATRLRIRTRMADTTQRLAALIGEAVPEIVRALCTSRVALDANQSTFRRRSTELLREHRRWVTYQSLLLLHEGQSTFAGRSSQEEALAQSFVDCLWRLHRCVRALFARLRVVLILPALQTKDSSKAHFDLARKALLKKSGDLGLADAICDDSAASLEKQAARLLSRVRTGIEDVSQCWRALGRCLSSWAAAQSSGTSAANASAATATTSKDSGGTLVGLLGCLHGFCACLGERVLPAVERLASSQDLTGSGLPLMLSSTPHRCSSSASGAKGVKGGEAHLAVGSWYANLSQMQLRQASSSLGFEESLRTLLLARRLSAARGQLTGELKQQARRLQAVANEKSQLSDELRALQDSHALLRSNFEVLKASPSPALGQEEARSKVPSALSPAELVMSSRQRALLESLSVSAQESAALRQHGFFVDVLSLSGAEVSLAGGPPRSETLDAWELALRKVYEQQVQHLQMQVVVADSKAMELNLHTQDCLFQITKQEEEKGQLRDEVSTGESALGSLREDMESTRKNYDAQLAMLTEHICALSTRLSEKDASLASLQAHKVLCGHCGMWNAMGKLVGSEPGSGTCQTCKEKVLSQG